MRVEEPASELNECSALSDTSPVAMWLSAMCFSSEQCPLGQ